MGRVSTTSSTPLTGPGEPGDVIGRENAEEKDDTVRRRMRSMMNGNQSAERLVSKQRDTQLHRAYKCS